MSLWNWEELEKRFYACAAGKDGQLAGLFENYLRHSKDDEDLRLYFQDRVREAEASARGGDPFYHPGENDGIHKGCLTLGFEARTGVPYRLELRRTGELLNTPSVNTIIAGPVGSGKTNLLAYITLQALMLCRVIVFARNASYRKRIPVELRDQFKVLHLEELKLCPIRPTYLDHSTPLSIIADETHKTAHWFCTAFGQRFSRHDALLLLHRGIELLLHDLKTLDPSTLPEQREWPGYHDIFKLFDTRAYRARLGGRSQHEESLTLTLKNFALNGLGVLNTRTGIDVHELFGSANLVIETGSYSAENAAFLIELLLGQLWLRQQHTRTSTPELKHLVVLDDLQEACREGGAVHRLIRISRHAGFSFLLAPQNIGALSNDVLGNVQTFVLVGPQTSQRDLTQSMAVMGLSFKDPMTAELQRGEPGRAIARQPFAAWRTPTFIRIPLIPDTEYDELERRQRLQDWLEQHVSSRRQAAQPATKTKTPAPTDDSNSPPIATPSEPSESTDFARCLRAFVTSANERWFEGHETHFAAAGVKSGNDKAVLLRHARAQGLIQAEDASVTGLNGKPIKLAIVTDIAREQIKLEEPESWKHTRGKQSTRYYQYHLARLLGALPDVASVELEGLLGQNLKRVDVLARLQNGKAICVEFASTENSRHEQENARVLNEAGEQIAKYVIVAETGRLRDKLAKEFTNDPRVSVVSFYDAIKQPTLLAPANS